MSRAPATAKLNLALVVGPRRGDGKHEVTTVYQRIDLSDRITIERARRLFVRGFPDDTLVRTALERLAEAAGIAPTFAATIRKRIPVASGLGGGSSDAATALRLANELLEAPLSADALLGLAAGLGADVPFFLSAGPQLGEGAGERLSPLELPQDYWVVIVLPFDVRKQSSAAVFADFDARGAEHGYEERRARLHEALARVRRPRDLAALPGNDLVSSPLVDELLALGAFRAGVSGAGPALYGLFHHREPARAATRILKARGRTWVTVPAWYF